MEENVEDIMEIFIQNGVLLKSAPAVYLNYLNTTGILSITEYLNSNSKRCIEWKPDDVIADSDVQEQEWDVVSVVERRSRTLSESIPPDSTNRTKYLRINFTDIKSFKSNRKNNRLTLLDGKAEVLCVFDFLNGNCDSCIGCMKNLLRTVPAKRDKHLFVVVSEDHPEAARLDKSFAELELFPEEQRYHIWKFLKNFQESPVNASLEAFSKVSDIGNYMWTYYFTVLQIGRYFMVFDRIFCGFA